MPYAIAICYCCKILCHMLVLLDIVLYAIVARYRAICYCCYVYHAICYCCYILCHMLLLLYDVPYAIVAIYCAICYAICYMLYETCTVRGHCSYPATVLSKITYSHVYDSSCIMYNYCHNISSVLARSTHSDSILVVRRLQINLKFTYIIMLQLLLLSLHESNTRIVFPCTYKDMHQLYRIPQWQQ